MCYTSQAQVGHEGLLNETLTPDRPCRDTQDCSGHTEQNALEAQDLPCTYLAHHEPESSITITTVVTVVGINVIIIGIDQQEQTNEHTRKNEGMGMNEGRQ